MTNSHKYRGYIGTYTKGNSEGIYTFSFDTENGKIEEIKLAAKLTNPTYVAISKDNRYLYSVASNDNLGGVAALSLNRTSGDLQEINQETTEGPNPCHVQLDSRKQILCGI